MYRILTAWCPHLYFERVGFLYFGESVDGMDVVAFAIQVIPLLVKHNSTLGMMLLCILLTYDILEVLVCLVQSLMNQWLGISPFILIYSCVLFLCVQTKMNLNHGSMPSGCSLVTGPRHQSAMSTIKMIPSPVHGLRGKKVTWLRGLVTLVWHHV